VEIYEEKIDLKKKNKTRKTYEKAIAVEAQKSTAATKKIRLLFIAGAECCLRPAFVHAAFYMYKKKA